MDRSEAILAEEELFDGALGLPGVLSSGSSPCFVTRCSASSVESSSGSGTPRRDPTLLLVADSERCQLPVVVLGVGLPGARNLLRPVRGAGLVLRVILALAAGELRFGLSDEAVEWDSRRS